RRRVVHHARATHRRRYGRRGQRRRARGPAFSEPYDWLVRPVTCRRGKREVGSTKSEVRSRKGGIGARRAQKHKCHFELRTSYFETSYFERPGPASHPPEPCSTTARSYSRSERR